MLSGGVLSEEILAPIRAGFFIECEDLLAELEAGLLAMRDGDHDDETVNATFRAVHSIKGSAGTFGFAKLGRFSHAFESALDAVRAKTIDLNADLIALMLRSSDVLADIVRAARDEDPDAHVADDEDALVAALSALAPTHDDAATDDPFADFTPLAAPLAPALTERRWTIRLRPLSALYAAANEPLRLLRDLARLGETTVALDATALPALADLEPEEAYLAWTVTLATTADEDAIRDVFEFVEGDCDLSIDVAAEASDEIFTAPASVVAPPAVADPVVAAAPVDTLARTLRVDLERIDDLINLVGELVINQSVLEQRMVDAGLRAAAGLETPLDDLAHLTRSLQESVMAMRAQPVKVVFQRLSRVVREVADQTGKRVRLSVAGEDTQVDRTVIERLTDPLTHMIRNAIDHGIETPADRRAAGKPEEGRIEISAAHRGGRIVIEVRDDGRGIDRDAVRRTAIRRGIIASDAVLSDEDIDGLIFAPGFSTATEVSALSGRGVGMDVVKRGVQALGGRIAVAARPGVGACFTLTLPLTLAVLDGMVVSVGGHSLVVPLGSLVESVQPTAATVRPIGPHAWLLNYRGQHLPMIDLGAALGYRAAPALGVVTGVALVVEDDFGGRAALLVDDILGQRQVVIKSLEANYHAVPGVAAATILGDGRVALILDVDAVLVAHRPAASHAPRALHQVAS